MTTHPDHSPRSVHPCTSPLIAVEETSQGRRLIAAAPMAAAEIILRLDGATVAAPTRYSVQVTETTHVAPPDPNDVREMIARYPWCFMNHSCAPTAYIQNRRVIALHPLHPGDAVTFDYNTTEAAMAEPFSCHCGAPECIGTIRGAAALTTAQRDVRAPHMAAYLSPTP
jgi:hypothetical protein